MVTCDVEEHPARNRPPEEKKLRCMCFLNKHLFHYYVHFHVSRMTCFSLQPESQGSDASECRETIKQTCRIIYDMDWFGTSVKCTQTMHNAYIYIYICTIEPKCDVYSGTKSLLCQAWWWNYRHGKMSFDWESSIKRWLFQESFHDCSYIGVSCHGGSPSHHGLQDWTDLGWLTIFGVPPF